MLLLFDVIFQKLMANFTSELNDYFRSKRLADLATFYDQFEDVSQLVEYMKYLPKGEYEIQDSLGMNEIVVVIPTPDRNRKYARHCETSIFKGFRIVFVCDADNTANNKYFNFAHAVNLGLKHALSYNPKWIVFSSDDMFKIDEPTVLARELLKLDNKRYDIVFTEPANYHSIPVNFGKDRVTRKLLFLLTKGRRFQLRVEKKFAVEYFSSPDHGLWRLFFKGGYKHLSIGDFGIFSARFVEQRKGDLYDETYINSAEDIDLSLELSVDKSRLAKIRYRIGDYRGSTLGTDISRRVRDIAGYAYLNWKMKSRMHPVSLLVDELKRS